MTEQLGLPGIAVVCPHCGDRRTSIEEELADDGDVCADRWVCRACGRRWHRLRTTAPDRPGGR